MITWLKYTLGGILAAGFIAGAVLLEMEAEKLRADKTCSRISVILADEYRFVNEDDVRKMVLERYGDCTGQVLDSIGLSRIESLLDSHTAIQKSQAWVTDDGRLNISVTQRKPVIRFMDGEKGYYVDATGHIFPLFERFTAEAPVVEGPGPQDSLWIRKMVDMVNYMKPQWMDRTRDIRCNGKGEITMDFADGDEAFLFGQPEDLDTKFRKVRQYFNSIKPNGRNYSKVDLRIEGQIICKQMADTASIH